MIFVERKDIDTEKWNQRVAAESNENVFSYTWYLDAVAENWGALITADYKTILPLPYTTKLGVRQLYQAPFTREYHIFGDEFSWNEVLQKLTNEFKHLSFRSNSANILPESVERRHQYLALQNVEGGYRSNAKRLIKKGNKFYHFELLNQAESLIQLFKDTVAHKIDSITEDDLTKLNRLMHSAIDNDQGEMIAVLDENEKLVAGGFFLKDKKRVTYLKGAATEEAKKNGAMYALFDYCFNRYKDQFDIFDFGGSDIENVATFYKKFGATDRKYYNYTLDNTPVWFKTLKKLKR